MKHKKNFIYTEVVFSCKIANPFRSLRINFKLKKNSKRLLSELISTQVIMSTIEVHPFTSVDLKRLNFIQNQHYLIFYS